LAVVGEVGVVIVVVNMNLSFPPPLPPPPSSSSLLLYSGIFLFIVYFQSLSWEFTAETLAILFVELCMGVMAFKASHNVLDAILVLSLYPLSLIIVYGLESIGFD